MSNLVTFHKCIQNIQELGTTDDCMISKLFFDLKIAGKDYENLQCTIKQTIGTDYLEEQALEVILPPINANFSYNNFSKAANHYYASLVGPSASGICFTSGSKIRMHDNTFIKTQQYDISA